tara:strand:+ start:131 stop:430 length:300 start_codon:yes stop_codon:yes gene_type:complete
MLLGVLSWYLSILIFRKIFHLSQIPEIFYYFFGDVFLYLKVTIFFMPRKKKDKFLEEEEYLFDEGEPEEDDAKEEVDEWEENDEIDSGEAAFLKGYNES